MVIVKCRTSLKKNFVNIVNCRIKYLFENLFCFYFLLYFFYFKATQCINQQKSKSRTRFRLLSRSIRWKLTFSDNQSQIFYSFLNLKILLEWEILFDLSTEDNKIDCVSPFSRLSNKSWIVYLVPCTLSLENVMTELSCSYFSTVAFLKSFLEVNAVILAFLSIKRPYNFFSNF